MKKYSTDYFEKKYKILFDKLLVKDGFVNAIKEVRLELEIKDGGFDNESLLANFLIGKMNDDEWHAVSVFAFLETYQHKNGKVVKERNEFEKVLKAYKKEVGNKKNGNGIFLALFEIDQRIQNHNELFTTFFLESPIFEKNKYLPKLSSKVFGLLNTFWGFDLLDEQITAHFIEKYLFLGDYGVREYIKNKIACHNCKYIGVLHFSPERSNMQGKDKGIYTKGYIFNKSTVKLLSNHFNSVFIIVKPYATKELAIQYIEDNWDDLKEHVIAKNTFYKQYGVHPAIIKESDIEKNRLVYELHKLPKKELLKNYEGETDFNHRGVYKESIISTILHEKYGIEMSPDAIKKSASRFSKSINVKREPKDIRDI